MSAVPEELLTGFLIEAREYLTSLRRDLTHSPLESTLLDSMAERLGILAGGAEMLGLLAITQTADPAAQKLAALAASGGSLNPDDCQQLAALLDQIDQEIIKHVGAEIPAQTPQAPPPARQSSPPIPHMPELPDELREIFLVEAGEHNQAIQSEIERLREQPGDPAVMSELRRIVHTLKGAAASIGYSQLANLAHLTEEVLERHLDNNLVPDPAVQDLLFDTADALDGLITPDANITSSLESIEARYADLLGSDFVLPSAPAPQEPLENHEPVTSQPVARADNLLRLSLASMDLLINRTGEIIINRSRLERQLSAMREVLGELDLSIKRLRHVTENINAHIEITLPVNAQSDDSTFDPLELDRYSLLYQFARELEELASDTSDTQTQLGFLHEDLNAGLTYERRLTTDLQDSLMAIRLVPFYELETRIRRIVHRTARDVGKTVDVVLSGLDTKVDKTILDTLADPLMHLLRNAVDHGIEPTAVREAAQKSIPGVIRLHVARERGRVVLTLSDDGAGIDLKQVQQRAVDAGLLASGDNASPQKLLSLLFEEGFSLARTVTQTSGRGVGLDIVRRAISRLQGMVRVDSTLGLGTTFVISVPVTLAITQAMFVSSCNQRFAIPLDQITAVTRLSPEVLEEYNTQGIIHYNGRTNSAYSLAEFVRNSPQRSDTAARYGLLVEAGAQSTIVLVESLMGIREAVVKSLGTHLRRVPGIAGATIAGDGSVTLILDLLEIVAGDDTEATIRDSIDFVPVSSPPTLAENPHVLVVDDSSSVRRVVCSFLKRIGWHATDAKDGIDALEKIESVHPDVALVDIEMPRMNGYELLARIKADPELSHIPVVFLTSRAAAKHRERAAQLHVDGYLVKPYRESELIDELLRVIRR